MDKNNISVTGDEFGFFLGKKLGEGCTRAVFQFYFRDTLVVKVATSIAGQQHNLIEQKIWDEVRDTKYKKHFARIFGVSPTGMFLVMEKVKFKEQKFYPKKIPHFFTDRKYDNYGWAVTDKRGFVCCDYANLIITNGITDKMVKADWWGSDE